MPWLDEAEICVINRDDAHVYQAVLFFVRLRRASADAGDHLDSRSTSLPSAQASCSPSRSERQPGTRRTDRRRVARLADKPRGHQR
jgi:hypothetical protein